MTDREYLELAAKAAGIESAIGLLPTDGVSIIQPNGQKWNPLTDDADALRLAVNLQMQMDLRHSLNEVAVFGTRRFDEGVRGDPLAATRRAIVRAAAEIGRSMK